MVSQRPTGVPGAHDPEDERNVTLVGIVDRALSRTRADDVALGGLGTALGRQTHPHRAEMVGDHGM